MNPLSRVLCTLSLASTSFLAPTAFAAPAATADFAALLSKGSAPMVTIKYILDSEGQEEENEVSGILIGADGLVLASNFFFGGGRGGGGATPKEIKILLGEDTTGLDAKFIARDTELGLAWLKLDKAPEKPLAFVDFSKQLTAKVGDEVFAVRKMGKFFGHNFKVADGRICAAVTKPRDLLIPSTSMATREDWALPVYNTSGEPIGVNTFILPEEDEMMNAKSNPLSGAEAGMILSAKDVAEATKRALENAANAPVEEKKEEPKEAPTDAPAEAPKSTPEQPK